MNVIYEYIDKIKCPNNITKYDNDNICVKYKEQNLVLRIKNNILMNNENNKSTEHLLRILNAKNLREMTEENMYDFTELLENINNMSNMCTICGENIINTKTHFSICKNKICEKKYYEIVTDNIITDEYKKDISVLNILILSAYACLKHPQKSEIFSPFPSFFANFDDLMGKTKYSYDNFNDLMKIIHKCNNDDDLFTNISKHDYSFLKFIIETNITDLKSNHLFTDNKNIFVNNTNDNILDEKEIISFQVKHDYKTELNFDTVQHRYLFHGSPLSNWYSILRNGIKNKSNTKEMLNGAAYGNGIYLSDSANFSYNYGADRFCKSGLYVIGVVQVKNTIDTYKKTTNIFVVPNEDEILLKYVIVCNSKNLKVLQDVTKYFTIDRPLEIAQSSIVFDNIKSTRIHNEFTKIEKMIKKYNIQTQYQQNKISIKCKQSTIIILYPEDYPSNPPHIYFSEIGNIINRLHIMKYGTILIDELKYNSWKTNTQIHKIIKDILKNVSDDLCDIKKNNCDDSSKEYLEILKT